MPGLNNTDKAGFLNVGWLTATYIDFQSIFALQLLSIIHAMISAFHVLSIRQPMNKTLNTNIHKNQELESLLYLTFI